MLSLKGKYSAGTILQLIVLIAFLLHAAYNVKKLKKLETSIVSTGEFFSPQQVEMRRYEELVSSGIGSVRPTSGRKLLATRMSFYITSSRIPRSLTSDQQLHTAMTSSPWDPCQRVSTLISHCIILTSDRRIFVCGISHG